MTPQTLRAEVTKRVIDIVDNSSKNHLSGFDEKCWESPLVGIAQGHDALFSNYKNIIDTSYWTPLEAMELEYPDDSFHAENLSVICWVLPQTEKTLTDQRREDNLPAKRWVYSRHFGEIFNEHLRSTLCDEFRAQGIRAVAPALSKNWGYRQSKKTGIFSNWSERHTAYVAGLGTFGLSDGFISEKGKAIRIGSIVVDTVIEADTRSATSHTQNCLYLTQQTCGICIKRCPIAAINNQGHDKQMCHDYIREVTSPYAKKVSGEVATPCGLCQINVPCERRNPLRKKRING